MLRDLDERAKFWSTREPTNFEGASPERPHARHEGIFRDARVLEIGPGAGRQFTALHALASYYCVADIASAVLAKSIYDAVAKLLITSYDAAAAETFDVVAAWYVVHHVRLAEAPAFFGFVARHLRPGGHAYFNVPGKDHPDALADDGIGTSPHDLAVVTDQLVAVGLDVVDVEEISFECVSVLAVKR